VTAPSKRETPEKEKDGSRGSIHRNSVRKHKRTKFGSEVFLSIGEGGKIAFIFSPRAKIQTSIHTTSLHPSSSSCYRQSSLRLPSLSIYLPVWDYGVSQLDLATNTNAATRTARSKPNGIHTDILVRLMKY
jgi:hypothetical protein